MLNNRTNAHKMTTTSAEIITTTTDIQTAVFDANTRDRKNSMNSNNNGSSSSCNSLNGDASHEYKTPPSSSSGVVTNTENITNDNCTGKPILNQFNKYLNPPPGVHLKDWHEMPRHLQFNPYVLKGYRPLQDIKGCFNSLFYMHNETVNILTHGIPIVYILATVPAILPWENEYRFLSWCHLVGSVAPWCGSFVYHLFMNLEHGEYTYYRLLQLDMLGIWISQSFGALPMVTATVFCLNGLLKWFIILSYCLLCIWGLYKALTAASPWQRRLCFALPFTMRIFLALLRVTRFGGGSPTSFTHVVLQDSVSLIGGVIGAMHIPEKWFPGAVDMWLNSHNIMHILVVMAVYSMHQATVLDIEWMVNGKCTDIIGLNNITETHTEL